MTDREAGEGELRMTMAMKITVAAIATLALTSGAAAVGQSPATNAIAPSVDAQAVAKLAGSLRAAIAALPRDAAQADIEAALVFAIDQSGQPIEVVLAALRQIDRSGLSPSAQRALAAVTANRARLAQRGTGSLAGGPTIGLAFGAALSVTGGSNTGSSDYGN